VKRRIGNTPSTVIRESVSHLQEQGRLSLEWAAH
jgi:hypothetical protein